MWQGNPIEQHGWQSNNTFDILKLNINEWNLMWVCQRKRLCLNVLFLPSCKIVSKNCNIHHVKNVFVFHFLLISAHDRFASIPTSRHMYHLTVYHGIYDSFKWPDEENSIPTHESEPLFLHSSIKRETYSLWFLSWGPGSMSCNLGSENLYAVTPGYMNLTLDPWKNSWIHVAILSRLSVCIQRSSLKYNPLSELPSNQNETGFRCPLLFGSALREYTFSHE